MAIERFSLSGRHVLVTGAARGLGRGIADAFSEAGARVVRADRSAGAGIQSCDVTKPDEVEALFREVGPIDILVCAAGITSSETVFEATVASFEQVLSVNVTGSFLCCKSAMERFRSEGRSGRIILIGSVVGHQGALRGHIAYAASKGAVHAMAKTLARNGAPLGVTVNAVAPGVVRTEMSEQAHGAAGLAKLAAAMPMGRLQEVREIADACLYLASEAGAGVTGTILDVNGGMLMR
ncbi:MAG: SDR family oxidoreductase [Methylobacterium sp.]|nr:SDR family oxidoreductase [Methylobacterium sp.]MCA3619200.1 SDR family oxidoreductase [Methylobacterium sp.]MCA3622514.1 SDR family oxidoreductase [Methylobacterium sp.]